MVTDLSMPGISGWDLVSELRARGLEVPVLMVTGHVDAAEPATNLGRFQLLQKPVSSEQLSQRLRALMG